MADAALRASRLAGPGIATAIDAYFAAGAPAAAPPPRDVRLAHEVLRSCRALAAGLDQIRPGAARSALLDPCRPELDDVESSVAGMLRALRAPGSGSAGRPAHGPTDCPAHDPASHECLFCASRRATRALRACIASLAASAQTGDVDSATLRAVTAALAATTTEAEQARRDLTATGSLWDTDSSRRAVEEALAAASALAESLRQFAQTARQDRPAARPQLAHCPPVPSPLSAGSGPAHHRRWVSEDIEGGDSGIQHSRNCSDSYIPAGSPRKSALSLRKPDRPPAAAAAPSDHTERSKQVRFQAAAEPGVDQASLAELLQLLSRLEAAIAALAAAHRQRSGACAPAAKNLVAAFVQISRLSSASGLVRHYGRAALAHFKTTTQAVKLLLLIT
ncbi:hypothetical protein IWQ57_004007 [Coemansia nantahalensis]|uniref:Uncharacterized protein n=1 Tax=Coemansia nantahalensis TaxID=2789366 RepID=A0ACC1JU27_9FUNG|nr:hypothetical protein IWQ57_004007 [Coemansia nantahalensis]